MKRNVTTSAAVKLCTTKIDIQHKNKFLDTTYHVTFSMNKRSVLKDLKKECYFLLKIMTYIS